MTDVVIEKKGHVAIVKIEHMKAMNALSTDMYAQLEEAFDELAKDLDNVYAVVLTGSSTVNKKGKTVNSFVAGADISEMATPGNTRTRASRSSSRRGQRNEGTPFYRVSATRRYSSLCKHLPSSRKPTTVPYRQSSTYGSRFQSP